MKSVNAGVEFTHGDALICAKVHNARVKSKSPRVAPRHSRRALSTWSYAVIVAVSKMKYRHRTRIRERERATGAVFEARRERANGKGKSEVVAWRETEYLLLTKMNRKQFAMTDVAIHGTEWAHCCERRVKRTRERSFYAPRALPTGRYPDSVGPRRAGGKDSAWDFTAQSLVAKRAKAERARKRCNRVTRINTTNEINDRTRNEWHDPPMDANHSAAERISKRMATAHPALANVQSGSL